jgi:hypothetical protein
MIGLASGCGPKEAEANQGHARPELSAFSSSLPTGDWIEVTCHESPAGNAPLPPSYIRGIIRFRDQQQMHWTSRIYDDPDCESPRLGAVAETVVSFVRSPDWITTDGSFAFDAKVPDSNSSHPVTYFGLMKVEGAYLYMALYPTAQARPAALDRAQAQVFSPF